MNNEFSIGSKVRVFIEWTEKILFFPEEPHSGLFKAKILKIDDLNKKSLVMILEGVFANEPHWIKTENIIEVIE